MKLKVWPFHNASSRLGVKAILSPTPTKTEDEGILVVYKFRIILGHDSKFV